MACRVLVTGVSGFVGGALGAYLRSIGGYRVTGLSRRPARPGSADASFAHDLTEPIPPAVGGHDVIVHCAALSSPWARPSDFEAHNVTATKNVLDYARRTACRRFVFISSSSVYYRVGDQWDITEDTPMPEPPINDYARTKRAAERLVLDSSIPSVVLRPRAVFGPGDTVLFPRILKAARRGMLVRIRRPDGLSPRCDLIYIDNLTWFIERAIGSGVRGSFNLTNGEPVDLYAFLGSILEQLGLPAIRRTMPLARALAMAGAMERASRYFFGYREPPITRFGIEVLAHSKTFDVSRATAVFEPAGPISLAEGMTRFVEWQRKCQ